MLKIDFHQNKANQHSWIKRTCYSLNLIFDLDFAGDYKKRKCVTELRISAHKLEIERGRHKGLKVEDRLCPTCGVLGDEYHYMMKCSAFEREKGDMLKEIGEIFPAFREEMSDSEKFLFIMSFEDFELFDLTSKYINTVFTSKM